MAGGGGAMRLQGGCKLHFKYVCKRSTFATSLANSSCRHLESSVVCSWLPKYVAATHFLCVWFRIVYDRYLLFLRWGANRMWPSLTVWSFDT